MTSPADALAKLANAIQSLTANKVIGTNSGGTDFELKDPAAGGGAPTTVDYLVGTADDDLSAEIVVGTTPGGELGGTWASPTVDATHSGSTHAATQAAAEATAAGALTTHEGAADPHTGYVREADANWVDLTDGGASTLHSHAGGGAPTDADYLVGTAHAGLSAEIVVGTTPGGELGGTWASPTVDATHSGTTHSAATDAHIADTTSVHAHTSLSAVGTDDHHAQAHVITGADHTMSGLTIGHVLTATSSTAAAFQAASGGDDSRILMKNLGSDFVSAASPVTTMAKATNLDQTLAAGTWMFEYRCVWQTSATATAVKFGVNFSGTATRFAVEATGFEGTTAASTGVLASSHAAFGLRSGGQNNAPSTTVSIFGPTAVATQNVDLLTVIRGIVVVTVSGDLQLYFGSEATGSTQTLELPTSLICHKIA